MNPIGRAELPKAIAIVQIVKFFESGGCTTVPILAEKYSKSERAINRWLADIDRYILPLSSREGLYRKWAESKGLPVGEFQP